MDAEPTAQHATPADAARITPIITLAFASDPLWGFAMRRADGRTDHHAAFWRVYVEGALRYPSSWLTVWVARQRHSGSHQEARR